MYCHVFFGSQCSLCMCGNEIIITIIAGISHVSVSVSVCLPSDLCVCVCSELVDSLLDTMHQCGSDFTNTFRCLSRLRLSDSDVASQSAADLKCYLLQQCASLDELQSTFTPRMHPQYASASKHIYTMHAPTVCICFKAHLHHTCTHSMYLHSLCVLNVHLPQLFNLQCCCC